MVYIYRYSNLPIVSFLFSDISAVLRNGFHTLMVCNTVLSYFLLVLLLFTGLGRSPGGGNGNPLQYSCLKNSMDRGAWWATVHGVSKMTEQRSAHTHYILIERRKGMLASAGALDYSVDPTLLSQKLGDEM